MSRSSKLHREWINRGPLTDEDREYLEEMRNTEADQADMDRKSEREDELP